MKENLIYVAVGANLPAADGSSPLQTCARAVTTVASLAGVHAAVRSRWFSTAPVPASDQPRYINGVLSFTSGLSPAALLAALAGVEQAFGRARGVSDAARTLDLDIIDMGGLVRDAPDPVLPHPRAHSRAFVLYPLRDVAPRWVHPTSGQEIGGLIAALAPQDIHPA